MYLRSTIGKWKKKIAGVCEEPEETTLREKKKNYYWVFRNGAGTAEEGASCD